MVKTRARDAWYDETRHLLESNLQEQPDITPEARELEGSLCLCVALLRAGVSPRALLLDALSNVVVRRIAPRDPRGRREDEAADELAFEATFLAVAVEMALRLKGKTLAAIADDDTKALEKLLAYRDGVPIDFAARLGEECTQAEFKAAIKWAMDNRRRHPNPLDAVRRVYAIPPTATLRSLREAGLRAAKRRAARADAIVGEVNRLLLGVTGKSSLNSRHSATSSPEKMLTYERRTTHDCPGREIPRAPEPNLEALEDEGDRSGIRPDRNRPVRESGLHGRRAESLDRRTDVQVHGGRNDEDGRQKRGLKRSTPCRRDQKPP
jgi:hypothetical protein